MQEGPALLLRGKNKYDIHPNFLLSHKEELFLCSFIAEFNLSKEILQHTNPVSSLFLSFNALPCLTTAETKKLALYQRLLNRKDNVNYTHLLFIVN